MKTNYLEQRQMMADSQFAGTEKDWDELVIRNQNTQIQSLESEVKRLHKKLNEKDEKIISIRTENSTLYDNISTLNARIKELEAENTQIKTERDKYEGGDALKRTAIDKLEAENEKLKAAIKTVMEWEKKKQETERLEGYNLALTHIQNSLILSVGDLLPNL